MTVEFEGKIEEIDNDLVIRMPGSEKARLIAFKGQTKKVTNLLHNQIHICSVPITKWDHFKKPFSSCLK